MNSFEYYASFSGNLEEHSKLENDYDKIKDVFNRINWEGAYETAEKCWDNHVDNRVEGTPVIMVKNIETEHVLFFTVARNEDMQWKIFATYNWQKEESSFFGLVKKKKMTGTSKLLDNKEEVSKIVDAFGKNEYEVIRKLMPS